MASFARITGEAVCGCIEAEGAKYVPGGCLLMKTHHQVGTKYDKEISCGYQMYRAHKIAGPRF